MSKERLKPSCVAYQGNNYLLPLRILSEVCRASGIPSVAYPPDPARHFGNGLSLSCPAAAEFGLFLLGAGV